MFRLPTPPNLSSAWNFGSLLAFMLGWQIVTGVFLAMHYMPACELAFDSVVHIMRDVPSGWWVRSLHANGASVFFAYLYLHVLRGLYHSSYTMVGPWLTGCGLLLLSMATAFMGYVLPWGQMSYWAATVITGLIGTIPLVGPELMEWVWGGFSIGEPTLHRFFVLHFIVPFFMACVAAMHVVLLHKYGSSNPLGFNSDVARVPFHPYFTYKDVGGVLVTVGLLAVLVLVCPSLTTEPENFMGANPLVTPAHIKPEWYFLWAYALLRSVPHKLGGVMVLLVSLLMLCAAPVARRYSGSCGYLEGKELVFWAWVVNLVVLSWLGGMPAGEPYLTITFYATVIFYCLSLLFGFWDRFSREVNPPARRVIKRVEKLWTAAITRWW